MTHYFLDSSALLKRFVSETGSGWIHIITGMGSANIISIAQITSVEVVSGIMRRLREGKISAQTAHIARTAMDGRVSSQSYTVVYLTTAVVQNAEDLLERHPLRAYDAVQLASALEANARLVAAQPHR